MENFLPALLKIQSVTGFMTECFEINRRPWTGAFTCVTVSYLAFSECFVFIYLLKIIEVNIFPSTDLLGIRKYYPHYTEKSGRGKVYNSQRSRIRCLAPDDI